MITEALTAQPNLRWCLSCRRPVETPGLVFCANCGTLLPEAPALDGRYALGESLGEGGFGHTYLAQDIRTRKPVAVKRVPRRTIPNERSMLTPQHFDRELKLLAELNTPGHPNIPEVLDTFSDDKADYLVMKYITGQTLKKKLETTGPLPWAAVAQILEQVLSALAYMKAQPEPVIHGDVKPNNLIEDETGRLFLVDFGMARRKSARGNWATESDSVAGTPGFASWDLWRGGPSPASDMYALGMTAFVLLAGMEHYDALISREQATEQRFTPHPGLALDDLQELALPEAGRDMLLAATATEPRERPTADDWLNALLSLREAKPTSVSGAPAVALRPLYFPDGRAAQTEVEFVTLADGQLNIATEFLYQDDTLARWLEFQCFRADLARMVRDIRDKYTDRHEAFELVLQALDLGRKPALLSLEPEMVLQRQFLTRGARGEYTLTNHGPGFARIKLSNSLKGMKIEPSEILLAPKTSQIITVSASARALGKAQSVSPLVATMDRLKTPGVEEWPITVVPAPWWFILREVVLAILIVVLGLVLWSAVQYWLPCALTHGIASCPLPPFPPPALLSLFH